MSASKTVISPQLARKVSPGLLLFTRSGGSAVEIFGIALTIFGLFGTVVLHSGESARHSAVLFVLGPWFFPGVVALCFTFAPFRPYRGVVFIERTKDIDAADPAAMRLVELFRSSEAKWHLWRHTLRVSMVLFVIMMLLAVVVRNSLAWSLSPADLGSGALALIGSMIVVSTNYIGWGLTTWAAREQ